MAGTYNYPNFVPDKVVKKEQYGKFNFQNVREPQSVWGKLNPIQVTASRLVILLKDPRQKKIAYWQNVLNDLQQNLTNERG